MATIIPTYRQEPEDIDYTTGVEQTPCDWCTSWRTDSDGFPLCNRGNIGRVEGTKETTFPWRVLSCSVTLTNEASRRSKGNGNCPDFVPSTMTRLLRKLGKRKAVTT